MDVVRTPGIGAEIRSLDLSQTLDSSTVAKLKGLYAAYEALPNERKRQLLKMKAHHSSRHSFGTKEAIPQELRRKFRNRDKATQDAVHPVVIRHPLSGRPALYVNSDFTHRFDGMTVEESQPLLDELYEHSVKPQFVHCFRWEKGSIAFWDNRATMHFAINDYHGQARVTHRITLEGEPLQAAA